MLHYMPGCDVHSNHPEAIEKAIAYMQSKNAVIDTCCRNEDHLLEKEDTIVYNCTMCDMIFKEVFPETERKTFYRFALEDPDYPWVDHKGKALLIQDCWRSRDDEMLHSDIRRCMEKMNIQILELHNNREMNDFCGVWLFNDMPEDCMRRAPKVMEDIQNNHVSKMFSGDQEKLMNERVYSYDSLYISSFGNGEYKIAADHDRRSVPFSGKASDGKTVETDFKDQTAEGTLMDPWKIISGTGERHFPVLVYCNGCEKGIRIGNGHPIHMMELMTEGL